MQKKTTLRQWFFRAVLVCTVIGLLEGAALLLFRIDPNLDKSRRYLLGSQQYVDGLNVVPQAYLLYIPAPGFQSKGYQQHNDQGYRGKPVPLGREPGSLRILFMGGSTTYGEGVDNPDDAYPAQVGALLEDKHYFPSHNIEIINAGLRWGTSAEILTHYLMKYRYYKPDLVVINTGGNDVSGYNRYYHPDLSNWRKPLVTPSPLRPYARWVLRSRVLSIAVIALFYPDLYIGTGFVGNAMPAKWFHTKQQDHIDVTENAFFNNVSTIVREVKHDGSDVFLLSYQGNPFHEGDQRQWRRLYDYTEKVLEAIGRQEGVAFAPFPLGEMPEERWVDPSHLDEQGEIIKARYVTDFIVPILEARLSREVSGQVPEPLVEPLDIQ